MDQELQNIAPARGAHADRAGRSDLRRLAKARVQLGGPLADALQIFSLDEDLALDLGPLFRVLAPMRDREYRRACAKGIEEIGREEAACWLGMAMHRKYLRRVLLSLRFLLIDPKT